MTRTHRFSIAAVAALLIMFAVHAATDTDSFTYSDAAADISADWVDIQDTSFMSAGGLGVSSNQLYESANDELRGSAFVGTAFGGAQLTQIIWVSGAGLVNVFVRQSGDAATFDGYLCQFADTGDVAILRVDDGVESAALTSGTYTPGLPDELRCEANGSSIAAYVDDVLEASTTDGMYATGRPAIAIFDNVARFDDFEAGDLSTGLTIMRRRLEINRGNR